MKDMITSELHEELLFYSQLGQLLEVGLFQGQTHQLVNKALPKVIKRYQELLEEFKGRPDAHIFEPNLPKGVSGIQGAY